MRTASKVNVSLGVILIGLMVTALLSFYEPSVRVKVLDPRIHVLSAKILRGTNDSS